jgi:hypothetical protein
VLRLRAAMLTLLVAFSPLLLAYVQVGLLRHFMNPRRALATGDQPGAELARRQLREVLAALGIRSELDGEEGSAPIELIGRDLRPIVGGYVVVHARLPAENAEATSADVLMLADRVWRVRGTRGLLVANAFSAQARTAARAAALSVELVNWADLAKVSPAPSPG